MSNEHYPHYEHIDEGSTMLDYFNEALDDERLDQLFDSRSLSFQFNTTTHHQLHPTLGGHRSFDIDGVFHSTADSTDFEINLVADTPHNTSLLALKYSQVNEDYIGLSEQHGRVSGVQLSAHDMTDLSLRTLHTYGSRNELEADETLPIEGITRLWSELAQVNHGKHTSCATAIQSFPRGDAEIIEARLSLIEEETEESSLRTLTIEHSLIHTPLDAETVYRLELFYDSNGKEGRHTQDAVARRRTVSDCSPELINIRLSSKNVETGRTSELDTDDEALISEFKKTLEAMLSNSNHEKGTTHLNA